MQRPGAIIAPRPPLRQPALQRGRRRLHWSFMQTWSEAISVLVVAAAPVVELRGAIPLALFQYQFDPLTAFGLAVIGNLLPVAPLLLGLDTLMRLTQRLSILQRGLHWWVERTQRRHARAFARLGALALVLFVAIPLPATGAWTGCLAAVLFGVPFRVAFPLIAVGVLLSGILITLGSLGVLSTLAASA